MAVSIVNQWTGSATATSSSINTTVANTAGNWLVVLAGWNPNAVVNPVVQVCDDARNYWVPLTISPVAGKTRCMAWAAPNARAATLASVSPAAWMDGLTLTVLEVSGMPLYASLDVVNSTQVTAATSVSVAANCTAADAVFAVAAFDNATATYTVTGTGFTALAQVSCTNATDGTSDDCAIAPCWRTTTGAGTVTASWTMSASVNASAVIIAVNQTASAPAQPNPNWPTIQDQMAWGYQPGDPTQLPTWTDITPKVSALSCKRGRQYELDKLQAGTANVDFRNNDGTFDPTNTSSAYAPNVVPYTPYRRLATWNGVTYPVFSGYVERWPQSWDGSRYGWSKAAAVDTLAPLAAVTLPAATEAEILQDGPYAYWPCNDSQQATAAGNASGRTQNTLVQQVVTFGVGTATAAFGAQIGLPGDTGTGWQQSGVVSTSPSNAGYILTTADRGIPQPPNGVGIELWTQTPSPVLSLGTTFACLAAPSGANSGPLIYFGLNATNGNPSVTAGTSVANDTATNTGLNLFDGKWHHHFVWTTATNVKWWIDGVKQIDHNWTMTLIAGMSLFTINGFGLASESTSVNNGIYAHVGLYDVLPTPSRIVAHYQAGATGFAGEGSGTRSQRILSYGSWTQPRLVDAGDTAMQAAADILGKTAPDALGNAFDTEIGLPSVDGSGTIRIRARHYTYNRPAQWTFDEQSGTPFDGSLSFDFDPSFVDNRITVDRNNGGQGIAQDQTSQKKYFVRSLNRTSYANADLDAVDQSNWLLGKYKDPRLRVSEITLNPAANPSVWPVALGVDVGDIATVTRRPTYAPAVTGTFVVQEVAHDVSPGKWSTKLTLAPVDLPVLTCDDPTFGVLGSNVLGW